MQQAVQSGDADVGHQRDLAIPGLGRYAGLLGNRQIAGAGGHDAHAAQFSAIGFGPADAKRSAQGIMFSLGEDGHQMRGRLGVEARHQAPLFVLQQGLQDRLDLHGRLPLAKDDLRETAADTAVQIDLGELARDLVRMDLNPPGGDGRRDPALSNGLEQLFQLVRIHFQSPEAGDGQRFSFRQAHVMANPALVQSPHGRGFLY